jgi:ribonuclease P protein component
VYAHGQRASSDGLTVIGTRSRDAEGGSRMGLVVPGAVGTAVVRNRIRRRLRAAFAELRPAVGFDIVVRGDAQAAVVEFQQLVAEMRRALAGAGITCEQ